MSNSVDQQQTREFNAIFEDSSSLNQETPNQPDPPQKSDQDTIPPSGPNLDSQCNSLEEEEEGEEIEQDQRQETPAISSGMSLHIDPPITDPHLSLSDTALTSPSGDTSTRRGAAKRKKGKGKTHVKKRLAIEERVQTLMKYLNPIPFIPTRILDFAKHENLLKKLGLWDFVHIDFDRNIRVDLIAQLVATYNPKLRASYVNDFRFRVNRADLARAFKLPLKKERGNASGIEVDLDSEVISEDSIGFMVDFMSEWVLLHEDTWMMPNEVADWLKLIKDGHPEKVDWAGLLWFMVEKELKQGGQLTDCYYAPHLQHLLRFQREGVILKELGADEEAKEEEGNINVDEEAKEEEGNINVDEEPKEEEASINVENDVKLENANDVGSVATPREDDLIVGGPSTELTLGQDGEKENGMKDVEMMDGEKSKDSDEERDEEDVQGQWLLNGKSDLGEHILQRCGLVNNEEFSSFNFRKDEDEEEEEEEEMDEEEGREEEIDGEEEDEEAGNEFHVFPNDGTLEGDGFTGNLLEGVEGNHMGFSSQDQLHDPSSMDVRGDMQHLSSAPSFFNNSGKRVLEHDNGISHHSTDDSNKRLRINDSWDNKPLDFGTCMDQIAQMAERAKVLFMEKDHTMAQSNVNQQILLNEVQKRDSVIEHLHKTRVEETQKKDREIFRLERELYLMGGVLDGYRKALKDVQKSFAEYRERANLAEESTYKDTGEGGLMLTAAELEKLRKKQEEEYKMKCLALEHNLKEMEEDLDDKFSMYIEKVNLLDKKLTGLEGDCKELVSLYAKRKLLPTEEKVAEVSESLPILEPGEKVAGASKPLPNPESEESAAEVSKPLPNPESEEKVAEVSELLPNPEMEEKVLEVPKSQQIPEAEAKLPEASEPLQDPETDEKAPEVAEPLLNE